ncbi:hypothetical protein MMC25_007024 [Agyrium rufum]|nr:hypothetical protein [Agyrium rufum]
MEKMKSSITIESTNSASSSSSSNTITAIKAANLYQPRIIKPSEYKAAAQCLADAFATDDVAQYFIETGDRKNWSEAQKWNLHVSILEYVVTAHCLKGLALTIGPDYDCVALWMPPGSNMDDWLTMLRSGMWRLNYKLSTEGKHRFFNEFLPLLHDSKAEILGGRDDNSWYLVYIGTKTSARGNGYARKLIEYVTKMADASALPCYLESSNDINPAIYRRLGFETQKKIRLTRATKPVELEIMVREPVAGATVQVSKEPTVVTARGAVSINGAVTTGVAVVRKGA